MTRPLPPPRLSDLREPCAGPPAVHGPGRTRRSSVAMTKACHAVRRQSPPTRTLRSVGSHGYPHPPPEARCCRPRRYPRLPLSRRTTSVKTLPSLGDSAFRRPVRSRRSPSVHPTTPRMPAMPPCSLQVSDQMVRPHSANRRFSGAFPPALADPPPGSPTRAFQLPVVDRPRRRPPGRLVLGLADPPRWAAFPAGPLGAASLAPPPRPPLAPARGLAPISLALPVCLWCRRGRGGTSGPSCPARTRRAIVLCDHAKDGLCRVTPATIPGSRSWVSGSCCGHIH